MLSNVTLVLPFSFCTQDRHHLSDKQLAAVLELLRGDFGNALKDGVKLPDRISEADVTMKKLAGVSMKKYDGCITCNKHVWEQSDRSKLCPICQGSRYDSRGQPLEQVVHFPLKPRLEALLRDSFAFKEAVDYASYRPRGKYEDWIAGVMHAWLTVLFYSLFVPLLFIYFDVYSSCADVYDSPRWHEMDEDGALVLRLLCCMDGIPAFTCNGISLMPMEFMLLNLPPWMRFKEDNMFISMLVPYQLSPKSQKKYFDKVIECDFNPMAREGLHVGDGSPIYVKIFGQVVLNMHSPIPVIHLINYHQHHRLWT